MGFHTTARAPVVVGSPAYPATQPLALTLTAVTVEYPGRSGSGVTASPFHTTVSETGAHVDGVHPGGSVNRTPATTP